MKLCCHQTLHINKDFWLFLLLAAATDDDDEVLFIGQANAPLLRSGKAKQPWGLKSDELKKYSKGFSSKVWVKGETAGFASETLFPKPFYP
jgi:hypothetical protein